MWFNYSSFMTIVLYANLMLETEENETPEELKTF